MLSLCLHPVAIRAGIGVGGWDVQLDNKGLLVKMDQLTTKHDML